jgi:alpha-galactosidase
MAIIYHVKSNVFQLDGKNSTYLIGVYDNKFVTSLYYGKKLEILKPERLSVIRELGFSPSPNDYFYQRSVSLDTLPQECPSFGYGDFRIPAITIEQNDGSRCVDLRYKSYDFPLMQFY